MITQVTPKTVFPAMQGRVGNRLATYATQLPPQAIETFLGHDPRSRFWKKLPGDIEAIYSKVQRATARPRLENIRTFVENRFKMDAPLIGAFPAVSIAVQNHVAFEPAGEKDLLGVGHISVDLSSRNARIVVDGVGRLSAVLELLEQSYDTTVPEAERQRLKTLLEGFTVPVVIYAPYPESPPLSIEEMGQLFFDFNFRQVPVPARIAISLDRSDAHILATNRLAKVSKAISENGGMEERAASLGKKSTAAVVQAVLLRFVRGALEGEAYADNVKAPVADPRVTLGNVNEHVEHLAEFLDTFAQALPDRFASDRRAVYLSSPGWQALGVIYNDVVFRLEAPDPLSFARALARIDWSREGPLWKDLMVASENDIGQVELKIGSASHAKREIMARLRKETGVAKLLEEQEAAA